MSTNTLLNYFSRTPVTKSRTKTQNGPDEQAGTPETPKSKGRKVNTDSLKQNRATPKTPKTPKTPTHKKRNRNDSLNQFSSPVTSKKQKKEGEKENVERVNSPEEIDSPPSKKRKRIIEELESEEEDSGDEYVPDKKEESSTDSDELSMSENENSASGESSSPSPEKKNSKKSSNRKIIPKSLSASFATDKPRTNLSVASKDGSSDPDSWPHLKYSFLQPDKIKDAKRRPPSDPNYDPKSLYVPDDFKNKQTPAQVQWWEIKSQNFDIVLFFKLGKFYELYHMDAVIAANELNLIFMRGEHAHVGFPETAYGRFSSTLIEKGYKVARIEQTETPELMEKRVKTLPKPTKFDRVVKREVCQITSRGTRVFGVLDGETKEAESNFLLAIAEKEIDSGCSLYGVCFVDTSIGRFYVGQFSDDRHSSRLRTLVAHYPPVQILYEKNQISLKSQQLFNTMLSGAIKESLSTDSEFWTASNTLLKLAENYYPSRKFPEKLAEFMGDGTVNMTVGSDKELGIRSLGAIVWYLQRCLIDYQLLTLCQFSIYEPVDSLECKIRNTADFETDVQGKHMILDAITLQNLNILQNSSGGTCGTLLNKLDNCCTPFGKRLLQRWICSPLKNVNIIKSRQEAVTFLKNFSVIDETRSLLSQLPDLERLLSKIHSEGSTGIKGTHPDTRAFLFEEKKYSKNKIVNFISALKGFKTGQKIVECFNCFEKEMPTLIRNCCRLSSEEAGGSFPDLSEHMNFFENAFDHAEALKQGRILPNDGTDADYDEAVANMRALEKETQEYLRKQCTHFGCKVNYFGSDRKRFQLEVPESATKRANSRYELQGQRKGFKRYWTTETKDFLEKIMAAEEQKKNVLQNLRERIFAKFSDRYDDWIKAVQCLSVLDVLISFAEYSRNENRTCVPDFVAVTNAQQPFVELIDGVYPCSTGDDVFIPNSTTVGSVQGQWHPTLVLVTGPNMGGKSTLMRQLGLISIMAHMGCHVPATKLRLSLIDRIFTRLGANDDIMAGESTFYVELCETSSILQHATKHSLVLIDELGRGTSTYDGTAIASAVLSELTRIRCRTLFSTHYHSLVEDVKNDENIALGHMACMVENDDETTSEETVTFLYKFAKGACPKSYGFNAARLAGMPSYITKLGQQRAKELEVDVIKRSIFRRIFKTELNELQQLIAAL